VTDVHRTVDAFWKSGSARIVAGLMRIVRDVGLAEELAQDALVAALEQWPAQGVPENPGAWLTAVAKRRAVDHIRREQRLARSREQLAYELGGTSGSELVEPELVEPELVEPELVEPELVDGEGEQPDDVLRLMFISCHPVLATEARVALTLRVIGGLTAAEIARAFLVAEPVVARRIAAAKQVLAEARVPFELPAGVELAGRLSSVLEVVYLIFNEGYSATSGVDLMRPGLVLEALRLGRLLAGLAPGESEVHGLVALMEIQASRSAARAGPSGEPVPLHEQHRGRWDPLLIRRGFTAMLRAREIGGPPGPYVLQAAIAVCHAQARTAEDTDWSQIATLYDALVRQLSTPIVQLNRAVAVGRAYGPQAGLDVVDTLTTDPKLQDYHLLPSVRGDLLLRLGRTAEARREFERAAALAQNAAERSFLQVRAAGIMVEESGVTLGQAVEAFLRRDDLGPATTRAYAQTLRRLRLGLGDHLPVTAVTPDAVARVFGTAWQRTAAGTWNRHLSAVRTFGAWAALPDPAAGIDRRAEPVRHREALPPATLDALWSLPGLPVREHTLWRLLHESGAKVSVVLALNVEDLDRDDRRARVGTTWVDWRSGTAALLPRLLGGRSRGPVFLADRRPGPARRLDPSDLCPDTGRSRLSYERAEYLFKQATRALDPVGQGWTLRQLNPRLSRG
jgi:predicted RNA polymerase sigma factor